jgi:hypothetical protein
MYFPIAMWILNLAGYCMGIVIAVEIVLISPPCSGQRVHTARGSPVLAQQINFVLTKRLAASNGLLIRDNDGDRCTSYMQTALQQGTLSGGCVVLLFQPLLLS